MIERYDWARGSEAIWRFGGGSGAVVLLAMPLFDEANRMRAFAATLLRAIAGQGLVGMLPDLPGTGESLVATCDARLEDWRAAFAAASRHAAAIGPVHVAALRGGALVDGPATDAISRWHFAPARGDAIVRELMRARALTEGPLTIDLGDQTDDGPPVVLAGNALARPMLRALNRAGYDGGGPLRTVRLTGDAGDADHRVEASPLWRRAEPANDPALAVSLAADLVAWVRSCGAS